MQNAFAKPAIGRKQQTLVDVLLGHAHPALNHAPRPQILDQVIEAIEKSASTGKIGDGKIFVFDLEQAIRIRTGESGTDAL